MRRVPPESSTAPELPFACALLHSVVVAVVWAAVMYVQNKASEARLKKEKEDKAAALKARS